MIAPPRQFHTQPNKAISQPVDTTQSQFGWIYCVLLSLYYIFSSITWSYIVSIGGLLIRPFDIVSIILITVTLLTRKIPLQKDIVFIFGVFFTLCLYLYSYGIFSSTTAPVVSATKIIYLLIASFVVGLLIDQLQERIRLIHFAGTFSLFLLLAVVTNPDLVESIRVLLTTSSSLSVPVFLNNFWRTLFQTNLFGLSEGLTSQGVSFRNSAALGVFSMILFVSGFVPRSVTRSIIIAVLSIVCFGLFSRTCWFLLSAFFITRLLFRRDKIVAIFTVVLVIASLSFSLPGIYRDIVQDRLYSESNRIDQYVAGLELMSVRPFVGHGSGTTITYAYGDISIHNVFIGLGVNYGILALFLALIINFVCLFFAVIFLRRLAVSRTIEKIDAFHSRAIAALAVAVVPHVSSSVDNIFSFGGWACFAVFLNGLLTYQRRDRTVHSP